MDRKTMSSLEPIPAAMRRAPRADWLVVPTGARSGVFRTGPSEIALCNGLVCRTFRLAPNAASVAYDNLMTGESMLRSVRPEASITVNGTACDIGGLVGQEEHAYLLPQWVDAMKADAAAFVCTGLEVGSPVVPFEWKRVRHSPPAPWPPHGASLTLRFAPPPGASLALDVEVHYEIYDGIPVMAKWLVLTNRGRRSVRLDGLTTEILAAVEYESIVDPPKRRDHGGIQVESDYSFGGMTDVCRVANWGPDDRYESQVNYARQTPCLLKCQPPLGPDVMIEPGARFESFRIYELIHDSSDRERRGMALRRMYRTLAPWAMENPLLMHVRHSDAQSVRTAIDQCAQAGFEMVIITFWSGLDMENRDPAYIRQFRELADYAHSKGIELGGYSLLASRKIGPDDDVINPRTLTTGGAIFGDSPCLCSRWGQEYFRTLRAFLEETGMDVLEHHGPYPGDLCASTAHPGHRGLADSQWRQWTAIRDFYRWCRGRGIYLNVPDWYFLCGSNKTCMGYRESNWSLPRDRQVILARQNMYDGTWCKAPSMGWMFVPLVQYHGGGDAATLEPLHEHLDYYGRHLAQNLGWGVQACYRGERLFDTPRTKAVVRKWVEFYKAHRDILESDVIHIRRPDGREIDCVLHVNPRLPIKAMAMVFNPLPHAVTRTLTLPLYYAGLSQNASVRKGRGPWRRHQLDAQHRLNITIRLDAGKLTWLTMR